MTDNPDQSAPPEAPLALPRSRVLGYIAAADSPTRVRIIASRALRILGWLFLSIAIAFLAWFYLLCAPEIKTYYHRTPVPPSGSFPHTGTFTIYGYSPYRSWTELATDLLKHWWMIAALAFYAGSCGMVFLASAAPVGRARAVGCYLSSSALFTVVAWMIIIAAITGAVGVQEGVGIGESIAKPGRLTWLILTLIAVVLALLLWDLVVFLAWIARNPIAEKPAVSFLPRRDAARNAET